MDIQTFVKNLTEHDWGFQYSDDHQVWRRGNENLARLRKIAQLSEVHESVFRLFEEAGGRPKQEDVDLLLGSISV